MAVSLTVTAKGLRDTAAKLKALNRRLESELNTMSMRERALNGMWDGQANDTFHAAYLHDVKEYHDFIQAIEEYIRALLEAADEYERTEQRNQSIASGRSYGGGQTSTIYVANVTYSDSIKFVSPTTGEFATYTTIGSPLADSTYTISPSPVAPDESSSD